MGRILIAAAIACAAVVVAVLALEVTSSDASTGPATVRVTTREVRYRRVDVGVRGRSPGDLEIVTALIYNRQITPRAFGHFELVCTFTIGPSRSCQGTLFLPKGKIVVAGPIYIRSFYQVAVVGGTGLYDNGRGTLTATRVTRRPRGELLLVRLLG
jgi:hypothetical protein